MIRGYVRAMCSSRSKSSSWFRSWTWVNRTGQCRHHPGELILCRTALFRVEVGKGGPLDAEGHNVSAQEQAGEVLAYGQRQARLRYLLEHALDHVSMVVRRMHEINGEARVVALFRV